MQGKARENQYDLLRIVSCIAVVCIHVSATYKTAITDDSFFGATISSGVVPILLWNTLVRFAVPCFVMLAGAFSLSNDKNADYKYYYRKTFKSIGIPTIVFSILYFLYEICTSVIKIVMGMGGYGKLLDPIKQFVKGKPYYHLWYLYMMIALYLLVPIIIRWKKTIQPKTYRWTAIILMFVTIISGWTSSHVLKWDIGFSACYLGYFLLGDVIANQYSGKRNNVQGVFLIVLGFLTEIFVTWIQYGHSMRGLAEGDEKYTIVGPLNPLIAVASVLIFMGFSRLAIKHSFSKLAAKTFHIYLIHAIVWTWLSKLVRIAVGPAHAAIVIPVCVAVVFLISYALSFVYDAVWGAIDRKLRISGRLCRVLRLE